MGRVVTLPPEEPPASDGAMPGGWWHGLDEPPRVVCDLCPRSCHIAPNQRGFCFVRENRDGRLVSTTYGRSTGFCVDPIEKKPLAHFYPGTPVLSFGTAGCNLGCRFCQNWTTSRSRDVHAACEEADPDTIARAAQQLGCHSVAFTYNDPIIWAEYAIDTARACRGQGIKTVAVTSGYIQPAAREVFYREMDAANVDLKAFSEDFYRELADGHLQPVLDTLRWIVEHTDCWLEITNLVIPQANDSPDEIERMCAWIVEHLGPDVPLHFSAFHPDFRMTDRGPTPLASLLTAHDIARQAGLRYVYTGNVTDREHQCTYCPGCGQMIIGRDGYVLSSFDLHQGRCAFCDTPIAGRFDEEPGDWGSRRMPVRIARFASSSPAKHSADQQHRDNNPGNTEYSGNTEQPPTRAKENPPVENKPSSSAQPSSNQMQPPRLSEAEEKVVYRVAGQRVAAVVRGHTPPSTGQLLAELANTPLYGAFVSLKRAGQLRSCCGYLGEAIPLGQALDRAAERAATDDPRFPPISSSELNDLNMEVWLLYAPQPVAARGEDRIGAVDIGRHGLQIARGANRGLLLPSVAVDHHLDAPSFLKQVCLKAGLPPDAWKSDDTQLLTFEGHVIRGKLEPGDAPLSSAVPGGPTVSEINALADFCRTNLNALLQRATPSFYLPGGYDGQVCGLVLSVGIAASDDRLETSRIVLRPELPLQATLGTLTEALARGLAARRYDVEWLAAAGVELTVLFDPAMHGLADAPQVDDLDVNHRMLFVSDGSRSAWVFDPQQSPKELVADALRYGGFHQPERVRVVSLAAVSTAERVVGVYRPQPQNGTEVRPANMAGTFYPGTASEVDQMLDEMLKEPPRPERWAAVMVPHAGWAYSGRLAADVFRRVCFPEQVIVLCPKHRPGGTRWAVAPNRVWQLPGGEVASDPELVQRLVEGIDGLQADAVPHQQEHAIEVQLPIIARLAPHARVVGIAIGGGSLAELKRFGQQLADVLKTLPSQPLLVISGDMNHFADETQTQRLDRMALDALQTLDPAQLYTTVEDNDISMCGMMPAVIVMEALRQSGRLTRCEEVGHTTSAAVSGDTQRVVGYAGLLLG